MELPNYLNMSLSLLDEKNIRIQLKNRYIKQLLVSQVIYVFSVWRHLVTLRFPDRPLRVGLIGCGVVGKLILNSLIPFTKQNKINTWQIEISTRRPEHLNVYEQLGMIIYFDNDRLIQNCDFIILGVPPTLDNWNILEMKRVIKEKQHKPFILSLISNQTYSRLSRIFQVDWYFHTTQINMDLIEKVLDEYFNIIQLKSQKVFQTEIDEALAHIIQRESYTHFYGNFHRISNFIQCLAIMNKNDTIGDVISQEFIAITLFGRTPQEVQQQVGKSSIEYYLGNAIKIGYDKRFYEYQSLIKS